MILCVDNSIALSDDFESLEHGNHVCDNTNDFNSLLSPMKGMNNSPNSIKKREYRKISAVIMPHLPQSARAQFEALYSTTEEDFKNCFWYYSCVVIAIAFACFQDKDLPSRYAFYSRQ